jgi:hypothetical protein
MANSYEISRTPTDVFTRELTRLVHQGILTSYRVRHGTGKRRFVLTWPNGTIQDVGAGTLNSLLHAVAQREDASA